MALGKIQGRVGHTADGFAPVLYCVCPCFSPRVVLGMTKSLLPLFKQKHPASPRKKFEPASPDSQARGEGECKRRSMHLWTHLDSTRQVQSHHSLAPLVLTSSSQGGCFLACVFHQVPGLLRLVVGVWYAKDDLPGAGTQGTGLVSRYCCCSCCPSQSGGLGQPCGDLMIGSVFARL